MFDLVAKAEFGLYVRERERVSCEYQSIRIPSNVHIVYYNVWTYMS